MELLAHRGYWRSSEERNSFVALKRALDSGFGVETDIRDYCGKLVISHDVPDEDSEGVDKILEYYKSVHSHQMLAINIKADGIQSLLLQKLEEYEIVQYFVFDMSIPELVQYREKNIKYYSRYSDIEVMAIMESDAAGVWMDSFYDQEWITSEKIEKYSNKSGVGIISPEIHGFDEMAVWNMIRDGGYHKKDNIYLCTDKPIEAKEFFKL